MRADRVTQALLLAVRWPFETSDRDELSQLIENGLDWDQLSRLQTKHRVHAISSHGLLACAAALPEWVRSRCEESLQRSGLAELHAAAEAQRLLARLSVAGVHAKLIKGPAASILAFGRLGLRTNRDLDLLVKPDARQTAALIIEAAGYRRFEPRQEATPETVARWILSRKDFVFGRDDGSIVELHWRLLDNSQLLRGLETCSDGCVAAKPFAFPTLAANDHLLYLCVHGAQHAWSRLKWLVDVAAIARGQSGEALSELLSRAEHFHVLPAVGQALLLADEHLGLGLAPELRRRLRRNWRVRFLFAVANHSMLAGGAVELEDRWFGTMAKNASHYAVCTSLRFWAEELRFDLFDLEAAGLPEDFRRFGPFARVIGPAVLRWRALFRSGQSEAPRAGQHGAARD